jgi:Zn-dependent protease with chaperone function
MATNFFEQQDQARKRTGLLLLFFGLGVFTLFVLVYALCAFLFLFLEAKPGQQPHIWNLSLLAVVAVGVSSVVGGASLVKMAQLSSGGKAVALMLNGQEIQGNTTDLKERRLLNVVEEMAIASGVPPPVVYLLPDENGINAFAAGHGPGDAVIAVSQGCLTYLTRDELQGVVGHEFSHILNGDMRLNLRVVGLIFGILALSQIGFLIMRFTPAQRSSNGKNDSGNLFLLGLGLYILGMGGAFFGWLIQAAVSRQRELLADSSSLQFTRNPEGIAGALKKIGGLASGSRIRSAHAGEVSHMFLSDAFMGQRFTDLLATHPPLIERIRRIDPNFDGVFPEVKPVGVSPQELEKPKRPRPPLPNVVPGLPGLPAMPALAAATVADAVSQVGRVAPAHVDYAQDLEIPDLLRDASRSAFSARALIYCLLLDTHTDVRERQLAQLKTNADARDFAETQRLAEPVRQLADEARLPLLDLTLPALRQMSPAQYQVFWAQVQALIQADNAVSLLEYVISCVLQAYLDQEYSRLRTKVRFTRDSQIAAPMATMLSLVAWEGQDDPTAAKTAFSQGMAAFSGTTPANGLLQRDQCQLQGFDGALRQLAQASPPLKQQVVAGCVACIKADQQVTVREAELLRAVCAALGCPMPPMGAGQS